MSIVSDVASFLTDGARWELGDPDSIPTRIGQHLEYSGYALALAAAVALPVGFWIGHTGRGAFLAINLGNAGRALPTLGLLSLLVILRGIGTLPILIALAALAIPPLLTGTYAGLRSVDRATVDAARGQGMREWQILFRAEIPMALPVIFSAVRNAVLQVVATATVAAYVAFGGLGRYLIDGLAVRDYTQMVAGAMLVAGLAIVLDLILATVQRAVVSPGVSGRAATRRAPASQRAPADTAVPVAEHATT